MRIGLGLVAALLGLVVGLAPPVGAQGVEDALAVSTSLEHLQARASDWGIRDAAREFRVRRVVRDFLGQTHVRLDQVHQGVPVWGRQLIVHLDAAGAARSVTGSHQRDVTGSARPSLTSRQARAIAQQEFPGPITLTPEADLVFYPLGGQVRLVYRVILSDDETPRRLVAFIDAGTGQIVGSYNDLRTLRPYVGSAQPARMTTEPSVTAAPEDVSSVVGSGQSLYSGSVDITTDQGLFSYRMIDGTRGGLQTANMGTRRFGPALVFRDADNAWGNGTNSDSATAGVDAHFGAEATWDYFLTAHGRNGIFDDGQGTLSRVHYGNNYNNAFWSDSCACMTYGDGDGSFFSPLVSLDVAGHEMTHGVTSATADLIYSGESGGLNEAMSDIFGTMVEFFAAANGAAKTPNYLIGEDIWTPSTLGDALRYMDDPTEDGDSVDHYSNYVNGMDVHYSSGIANNAFYLLAEGGTHRLGGQVVGIGRADAEAIFYLALSAYMTPSTTFSQARADTRAAAVALFGLASQQVASLAQAWSAVGVTP